MNMTQYEKLTSDMSDHFYDRMRNLLQDTADTCEMGGMSDRDTVAMLLSILMSETAKGSIAIKMTEEEFLTVCAIAYRRTFHAVKTAAVKDVMAEDTK
jgi:hypothetical protein